MIAVGAMAPADNFLCSHQVFLESRKWEIKFSRLESNALNHNSKEDK